MEEFNSMNLDSLLNDDIFKTETVNTNPVFESADVDVQLTKEPLEELVKGANSEEVETEPDNPNLVLVRREEAMKELANYEAKELEINKLMVEEADLQAQLDAIIMKVKSENKELIDSINSIVNKIEVAKKAQDIIKDKLLPLQRYVYLRDESAKTLKYNKVQSTYVEPAEKNKFDLKKFREKETDFWNEHLDILRPYSEITEVSDYLKITISKK